jgi:hypothetical protein
LRTPGSAECSLWPGAEVSFIKAIQNISDWPRYRLHLQLADQALQKAIVFSELLAAKHAKAFFATRGKNHGFGRGCLGCWVDPKQVANPAYLEQLAGAFGLAMVPFNWGQIERKSVRFFKTRRLYNTEAKENW